MTPRSVATDEVILFDLAAGHVHLDGGYTLVELVAADGTRWPYITDDRLRGEQVAVPWGNGIHELATHERVGRQLPEEMREALGLIRYCGAPTRKGTPCRARVTGNASRCGAHADVEVSTELTPAADELEVAHDGAPAPDRMAGAVEALRFPGMEP